jgi:inhibitor of KinA
MTITPLGEETILAYLPDEAAAVVFAHNLRAANPSWLQDVVPAYACVGVFFDATVIRTAEVIAWLKTNIRRRTATLAKPLEHTIPVCYDFPLDLPRVRELTNLDEADIIEKHSAIVYTVYAIGFVPGFPYLGYLPPELSGVPRLPSPRLRVEPGTVGLTGKQTGIYPLARPGGWNLIGRTPLVLVDEADGYFPLRVGDRVRFHRIDEQEYHELEGERLPDRPDETTATKL